MDARRPVIRYHAKKPFVTKASDNNTSETHVTGVYTSHILLQAMTSHFTTQSIYLFSQSLSLELRRYDQ